MKKIILLLMCIASTVAYSQVLKERRVYYLDCSFSMVQNKLWDKVRSNLVSAIDNINDETTEIVVIPFANNNLKNPTLKPILAYATAKGKSFLKTTINNLPQPNKTTMTYHYIPVLDFYNKRISTERVTYMFLMTDGKDEDPSQTTITKLLPQWGAKYGNKNVYGFYVMLHEQAANPEIDRVCKNQDHLWKVATADVNINLVRLQSSAIFNAKNDNYFDLRIDCGDVSGKSFSSSFPSNCLYKVRKTEKLSNIVRVWVAVPGQKLPKSSNYNLIVKMTGGGKFDFLVTDNIPVKCEYKPERSLKISIQ